MLQVRIETSVPAKVIGVKPKFWVTARFGISAHHAVKIPNV